MEYVTPQIIAGTIVSFGLAQIVILAALKKLGLISFGNNSDHKCGDHNVFYESFKEVRDHHIACKPIIEQHGKDLEEGKAVMAEIRDAIIKINLNVALIKRELKIKNNIFNPNKS